MDTMRQQEQALIRAAEQVRMARGDVQRLGDRLGLEMQGLRAQWAGRGGTAFQSLMVGWAERQRRILGALETLAAHVETTERDTGSTDDVQAGVTAVLLNRLG